MSIPSHSKQADLLAFWNTIWVGIPLWLIAATSTAYWFIHSPSPGKAVGALAVVAGIMSIRDMKVPGKLMWVVVLVCMLVAEFHAIDRDRAESDKKQRESLNMQARQFQQVLDQASRNATIAEKKLKNSIDAANATLQKTQAVADLAKDNLENVTGGNSFAFVYPDIIEGEPTFQLKIHNDGKQILSGVVVTMYRVIAGIPGPGYLGDVVTVDRKVTNVGVIAPNEGRSLPDSFMTPIVRSDGTATYRLWINAQNQGVAENIELRPSIDGLSLASRVTVYRRVEGAHRHGDIQDGKFWARPLKDTGWVEPHSHILGYLN